MNEELPDDFDIIVVGTGLSESIISGALSRIGKRVLHLDHSKHYGSDWSSLNLRGFEEFISECDNEIKHDNLEGFQNKIDSETESYIPIKNIRKTVKHCETICFLKDEEDVVMEEETQEETAERNVDDGSSEAPGKDTAGKEETESKSQELQSSADDAAVLEEADAGSVEECADDDGTGIEPKCEEQKVEKTSKSAVKNTVNEHSKEHFYSKWRHYNLDLSPKLMFSRGKLVELLIVSNVCRYLEFRNVTGTLTLLGQNDSGIQSLVPVPCSRTDIFNSKLVTMVEKRMLMRVLTICANYENHPDEYKDFENRPFIEFLAAKKLSKKLQHFIIHSIAMVNEDSNTVEGLKASEKFLKSLGRYGNSAFLWTTYGVGELPQAFCRLGAVFGGTFCLNRSVIAIIVSKETGRCVGIIDSTGQRLKCDHLVLNESFVPEVCEVEFRNKVARAIYVTDSSFMESDKGNVSLVTIPPTDTLKPARLIEVGPSCCVCPNKLYVVHGLMKYQVDEHAHANSAKEKFSKIEEVLFNGRGFPEDSSKDIESGSESESKPTKNSSPNVIWAAYFNMFSDGVDRTSLPENVLVTNGPDSGLGFDDTISGARSLFETICPDEEFLPRAPNPEEIVYFDQNDEGYNTETNGAGHTPDDIPGEYQDDEGDFGSGEPSELEENQTMTQEAMEENLESTNEESTPSQ